MLTLEQYEQLKIMLSEHGLWQVISELSQILNESGQVTESLILEHASQLAEDLTTIKGVDNV